MSFQRLHIHPKYDKEHSIPEMQPRLAYETPTQQKLNMRPKHKQLHLLKQANQRHHSFHGALSSLEEARLLPS